MASGKCVYRSRYLHEADMVAEALEHADVAFFRALEDPGGVRFAMPIPAPPGLLPLSVFLVIVPERHAARGRRIIESLPVSHEDD